MHTCGEARTWLHRTTPEPVLSRVARVFSLGPRAHLCPGHCSDGLGIRGPVPGSLVASGHMCPRRRGSSSCAWTASRPERHGAFVAGKTLGHRKLARRLRPNRTLEGVIGNVMGAWHRHHGVCAAVRISRNTSLTSAAGVPIVGHATYRTSVLLRGGRTWRTARRLRGMTHEVGMPAGRSRGLPRQRHESFWKAS